MKSAQHHGYGHTFLASAVAIALAGSSAVAKAQQIILEEIIVTAQKRAEGLQDVPISISTMSGERIDEIGIAGLEELTQYIPNVTINNGAGTPNLFIRGVGSGTNAGFEQSVGLYIDGVYSGRGALATVPNSMDLQRIEVLKGREWSQRRLLGVMVAMAVLSRETLREAIDGIFDTKLPTGEKRRLAGRRPCPR